MTTNPWLVAAACWSASCAKDAAPITAPTVHVYSAPAIGAEGSVNTYFLETPHGLIVIDGLRTLHEGNAGLAQLQQLGKPIEAVILTHAHPDHVGGLGVFAAAAGTDARVYGSSATRDEIVNDPHGYFALSVSMMPGDFPSTPQPPTLLVTDGQHVTIDGLELVFDELGAGESVSATIVSVPAAQIVFAGDLTSDHMAPFLLEGRTSAWLAQLGVLERKLAATDRLYPGHGTDTFVGDAIAAQRAYLTTFLALVDQHRIGVTVDAGGRAAIAAGLTAAFGDEPPVSTLPDLLDKNIDAVAAELAGP